MKTVDEFKQFIMRGNVVDMAVGIMIGGAFGKIVSSLVTDVIMPTIGLLLGGINFSTLHVTLKQAVLGSGGEIIKPAVLLNYGNFIQVTIDFLIIAFSIFMMIKLFEKLHHKKAAAPVTPPPTPEDVVLLREIRDLLKRQDGADTKPQ